jgi:hypothetical protein
MSERKQDILTREPSDPHGKKLDVYLVNGKDCGQGYSGPPYTNLQFFGKFASRSDLWECVENTAWFCEQRPPNEYNREQWTEAFERGQVLAQCPDPSSGTETVAWLLLL